MRKSANIYGTEVIVDCELLFEAQANWLLDLLVRMPDTGVNLRDGTKLRFGWSILTFRKQVDGSLLVHEPNFFGNPFEEDLGNLNDTFMVTLQQKELSDKIRVPQCEVAFHEKIVLAKGALSKDKIYLERIQPSPENNDSGWYIGERDCDYNRSKTKDPSELEAVYLFQLMKIRPSLIQILTLPAGYMVLMDGNEIVSIVNDSGKAISVE